MALIRKTIGRIRHGVLRWRQKRARRAAQHERAYGLLMRELYTDFSRAMVEIHMDMAWERLAAGKAEDANSLLRLVDDSRIGDGQRIEKRLLQCWALVEQGKHGGAETQLRALEGERLSAAQRRRRDELGVEACLVRRDPEAARDRASAPALQAWRAVAEAEIGIRDGDPDKAHSHMAQARTLLGGRTDVPWIRRRLNRLQRDRK